MPAIGEVTREWVAQVLSGEGYEVTMSQKNPDGLVCKHSAHPNLQVSIRRDASMITFIHYWGLESSRRKEDDLKAAVNRANLSSYTDTFAIDDDHDLMVSSYLYGGFVSEHDLRGFVRDETASFMMTIATVHLTEFMK